MANQFTDISAILETWYQGERGSYLLAQLQAELDRRLETAFGYHMLQLGPLDCGPLFGECRIRHRIFAGEQAGADIGLLCERGELPLESDSIDVIIAHHALEFVENPHQVLRELQRVLVPQGQLLITGWNPHSLVGLGSALRGLHRRSPWRAHRPVSPHRLTDWLNLLGCDAEHCSYLYNLPPLGTGRLRQWMEKGDQWCATHGLPTGGLYLMHAVKQVPAHKRPRSVRRRAGKLIGLAVPGPAAQPSPAPAARPIAGAARKPTDPARH
ncbi:class I SAM-dependent methyltransferase [Mangrovimicrobium sediminis]|nr:class I SAM-dependent methyltransferase [Haliea sp. SAOS-164]